MVFWHDLWNAISQISQFNTNKYNLPRWGFTLLEEDLSAVLLSIHIVKISNDHFQNVCLLKELIILKYSKFSFCLMMSIVSECGGSASNWRVTLGRWAWSERVASPSPLLSSSLSRHLNLKTNNPCCNLPILWPHTIIQYFFILFINSIHSLFYFSTSL